jgi:Restriction endonuclease fold toxin 5
MLDLPSVRTFRLSRGGIECDEQGLRVGDLALLVRDRRGAWAPRDESDLAHDLSHVYGIRVDARAKMAGFGVVAKALQDRNLAKAQIAALLLRLPDPPSRADGALAKSAEQRLYYDLVSCGLLKADADWDEKHPRAGSPPNPGWFASKPQDTQAKEPPKADAKPIEGSSLDGSERAFLPSAPLVAPPLLTGPGSWLTGDLPATVLDGLVRLAARFSAPAILFGAIFIPSANGLVDEGPVPGRPNMTYRWAHDEVQLTFKALIDGQWRELTTGFFIARDGAYYDKDGQIVARVVQGAKRPTLVTNTDVLDNALARLRPGDREPDAKAAPQDREPELCPKPVPEPMTAKDKINSIRYQEYVTKLTYPLAIYVGGVYFDGCDPKTGDLLEAKAYIDFMYDSDDQLWDWIDRKSDPRIQMEAQAEAAAAVGRRVIWHAQTEKGYRGLKERARELDKSNLYFVFDPN